MPHNVPTLIKVQNNGSTRKRRVDIRFLHSKADKESDFITTLPSSVKATRCQSLNPDSDDSIDDNAEDSMDAFWSCISKRNAATSTIREKVHPLIRTIRERATRSYVHDKVQLNDDIIVSQIYSNYIKKTKSLLNNYIQPGLDTFSYRKCWFLDTGKEVEAKGEEFAKFLLARTKFNRHFIGANKITRDASSLSSQSKRGGKQRSVQKRVVRFEEVPDSDKRGKEDSKNSDAVAIESPDSKKEDDRREPLLLSLIKKESETETPQKMKRNGAQKSNGVLSMNSSGSSFKEGEPNANNYGSPIRGILKKEAGDRRLFVPARRANTETSTAQGKGEPVYNELKQQKGIFSKEGKGKADSKSESEFQEIADWRGKYTRRDSSKSNQSEPWNRSMRLLREINVVSRLRGREKPAASEKMSDVSSYLGIQNLSVQSRRRSVVSESSSQASNSPTRWQRGEMRGRFEAGKGAWKGHQRSGYAEKESKRNNSRTKQATKLRGYNDMGVGKVAEVTTVSSFVRYEFDIPDDLDDNLEHFRLHGYLRK